MPVKFVSFSGIDGAGKSSQIRALSARLECEGVQVQVVAFWEQIARLRSLREKSGKRLFGGDTGVGSPEAPINRRDKNVRTWPMTCLRTFLYLLDSIALRRFVIQARRAGRAKVVIFDRYIYDELANLNLSNGLARSYARLIMKLTPAPDLGFLLDADPVDARARKPEYPLEFIHLNRQSYLELSRLVGGITIIPPMPIEDVEWQILHRTRSILANQNGQCELSNALQG